MASHGVPDHFGPVSAAKLPSAERPIKDFFLKMMVKPFLVAQTQYREKGK
jgi:hypothetical protein